VKISVITVCFNSARTIAGTIESFLAQDHNDKELIVIDGGSRDGTLAIVNSFRDDRITAISEPDDGLYEAANKGLERFTGAAVGLLNSDDVFADSAALGHIAEGLAESDVIFGNLDFVGDSIGSDVVRRWRGSPFVKGAFRNGWMPAHPTFYVRRPVIDRMGGFDTRYRIAADYDFMLRVLELGNFRSRFIDRVLVRMLDGGASTSGLKAVVQHNYEALCSRRMWLDSGLVDYSLIAKPLRKVTQLDIRALRARLARAGAARIGARNPRTPSPNASDGLQ
jgi:glycosyltransferase involved in cell wall biosynthesis